MFTSAPAAGTTARFSALALVTALIAGLLSIVGFAAPASAAAASATFTVKAGTANVGQVTVELSEFIGTGSSGYWSWVDSSETSAAGLATFTGLATGKKYQAYAGGLQWVEFPEGVDKALYSSTYLGSTTAYDSATAGYFTAAATNPKTIQLQTGYAITGDLFAPNGDPIDELSGGAQVTAYRFVEAGEYDYFDQEGYSYTESDSSSYSVGGLRPGSYALYYEPSEATTWGGVFNGGGIVREEAPLITIGSADSIDNDAQFVEGGSISGVVTLAGLSDISEIENDIYINVFSTGDDSDRFSFGNRSLYNGDGTYSIPNLAPGSYAVVATTYQGELLDGYFPEIYDNASSFANATPVVVEAGSPAAADFELEHGFTLSGTVTAGGNPVAGITVTANAQAGLSYHDYSAVTGSDGTYTISNVAPADYQIQFSDPSGDYATTYATLTNGVGTTDLQGAGLLGSNSAPLVVDMTFPVLSAYDITVTTAAGLPITNAYVDLVHVKNGTSVYPSTAQTQPVQGKPGTYRVTGLLVGEEYAPYVYSNAAGTYNQYLGGSTSVSEAELVTAKAGTSTLQFSLASMVSVKGTVKNSAGVGVANIGIQAYSFDGTDWVPAFEIACSSCGPKTVALGAFTLPGLAPGSYKFEFLRPYASGYTGGFYGGATLAAATPVYVGPGATVSLAYTIPTGGSIAGSIKGSVLGSPFGGGYVTAYKLEGTPGNFTSATAYSESFQGSSAAIVALTSKFSLPGLPSGYYAVQYEQASSGGTYPRAFIGGPDALHASVFKVVAGAATAAPLYSTPATIVAGGVQGTVTRAGGGDLPNYNYWATLVPTNGSSYVEQAIVERDGSYSIASVPDGDYTLSIDTYVYPTRLDAPTSVAVTVAGGFVTTNIELQPWTPLAVTEAPTVSALPQVGVELEALPGAANLPSTASFQWYVQAPGQAAKPIRGANSELYTPSVTDFGKKVFVRVTHSIAYDTYFVDTASSMSAPVTVAGADQPYSVASPSITPSTGIIPGTVLRALNGNWSVDGLAYAYQWYANDVAIAGATSITYALAPAFAGQDITVKVIAKLASATDGYAFSDAVETGLGAVPVLTTAPVISSAAGVLKVTTGVWKTTGLTFSYAWSVDGVPAASTTNSLAYTGLGAVRVTVTASKVGFGSTSKTLVAKKSLLVPEVAAPPIAQVGGSYVVAQDQLVSVGDPIGVAAGIYTYPNPETVPAATSYQWQVLKGATWTSIVGATKADYTPIAADLGRALRVNVTVTSSDYAPRLVTVLAGTVAPNSALLPLGDETPGPLGTFIVGTTATAVPFTYGIPGVTFTYQWQRSLDGGDYVDIPLAKAKTFVIPASDADKFIRVVITANKPGYSSDVETSPDAQVSKAIYALTPPALTPAGSQKVGATLTTSTGTWVVAPTSYTYRWFADGELIVGATAKTYKLVAADLGKVVEARVTPVKAGFDGVERTSNQVTVVDAKVNNVAAPTIAPLGFAKAGAVLSATAGKWDVVTPTFAYQWFRGEEPILGATAATYKTTAADVESLIRVRVTAAKAGFTTSSPVLSEQSVRIMPAGVGAAPTLPTYGVPGSTPFGIVLQAPTTNVYSMFGYPSNPAPATMTYQWYLGTTAIAGATASSYTPKTTDIGKAVRLKVTATSAYYATASYLAPATTIVTAEAPVGSVGLSFDGWTPGKKLTVTNSWDLAGLTYSYAWQRSSDGSTWSTIAGATAASYVLTTADPGFSVRSVVTAKKAGYGVGTATTSPFAVFTTDSLQWLTPVTISGTKVVGAPLTAVLGTVNVTGTTYKYQWLVNGNDIPGATAATFSPAAAFFNQAISVRVTALKPGYASGLTTSPAIELVNGTAPTVVALKQPKISVVGALTQCSTLSVGTGTWTRGNLQYSYQWLRNGEDIPEATTNSYTTTDADAGLKISVRVTASSLGFADGVYTTVQTAAVPLTTCG